MIVDQVSLMTIDKYADITGLSRRVVESQIFRGHLPTVKIGRRRMINVVELQSRLQTSAAAPTTAAARARTSARART